MHVPTNDVVVDDHGVYMWDPSQIDISFVKGYGDVQSSGLHNKSHDNDVVNIAVIILLLPFILK